MFFHKKENDNGYNKFQIVVANIRAKQRTTTQMYDLAWKALARVIEQGNKTEIKSKVQNEFRLKQKVEEFKAAGELAHSVYKSYKELWEEHPSKEIQDQYVELCTYREVLGVPSLGEFWFQHKIAGNDEAKQDEEFDEDHIASYLREFAVKRNVNQRGKDNIEMLFADEEPKGNGEDLSVLYGQ